MLGEILPLQSPIGTVTPLRFVRQKYMAALAFLIMKIKV